MNLRVLLTSLFIFLAFSILSIGFASSVYAGTGKPLGDVTINSAITFAAADASDGTSDGVLNVAGNLTMKCHGSISCNDPASPATAGACKIQINVTGDFIMEAGSSIYAENRVASGNGGDIIITVNGEFTMDGGAGGGCPGAIISSGNLSATAGNMNAGAITINAGKDIDIKQGSTVKANAAKGTGGTIDIHGSGIIDIYGSVLSHSTGSGSGTNQGHGGPIKIVGACKLTVSDDGIVSSKGIDPGADLVHLEACDVTINGLVESTGAGHALPSNPPNHLNGTNRPDKDPNSTAGIEVWAGTITIDRRGTHKGEIKADLTAGAGNRAWIDLFASKEINVYGRLSGVYAVHANVGGSGGKGGTITVKSVFGTITATGLFIQANSTGSNFREGGLVTIESKYDLTLTSATMEAKGANKGGKIALRAFGDNPGTGNIIMNNGAGGTSLNVTLNGTVNKKACGAIGVANITGASVISNETPFCGGNPLLPLELVSGDGSSYVTLPAANCSANDCTTDQPCECIQCDGEIIVTSSLTINLNPAIPTISGPLAPYFSYDKTGATGDKWKAIFNLGGKKLIVKSPAIITTTQVSGAEPGIEINTTCEVEVESGAAIKLLSGNHHNDGDIVITANGNIDVSGQIRNEVQGVGELPGAITVTSKCANIDVSGLINIYGRDPGGNLISLITCVPDCANPPYPGDITISGLVKSFAHGNEKMGWSAGVWLNLPVASMFSVEPQLMFSSYRYYTSNITPTLLNDGKIRYISLPVLLKFHLGDMFAITAGPQVDFFTGVEDNNGLAQRDDFKKTSFSLSGGLEIMPHGRIAIFGRYLIGLTNMDNRPGHENDMEMKNQNIQAGLKLKLFGNKEVVYRATEVVVIDTDGDGIADGEDKCPTVAGTLKYNGCPIPDTDGDGINDELDKCPAVAGTAKYEGCPIPDTDGDGINDELDKCPNKAGTAKYEGCPIPDTDGDGINDEEDKCPTEAGIAARDGCPVRDRDNDGVNDEEDRCPDIAGVASNKGCPEFPSNVTKLLAVEAQHISFGATNAKLNVKSNTSMDRVVTLLNENPGLSIKIEGHTDNAGDDDANMVLSRDRADAVKAYIVSKGISEDRITAEGFGESTPIADNGTAAGRAKNRRIEIKVAY